MACVRLRTAGVLAALLLGPLVASADPPAEDVPAPRTLPGPELLLPPQPLLPLGGPGPQPSFPPEFGRLSVWQFYGVDRYGRFRPLVVQTPYGAFYRYNGAPFPWANVHGLSVTPRVVSTTTPHMPYAAD